MGHGGKREGAGRKAGATSEEIKKAREAISKFCDANSDNIQTWFDDVAKQSPEKALEILYKYLEFHVPKLSRQELKHEGEVSIHSVLAELDEQDRNGSTKED